MCFVILHKATKNHKKIIKLSQQEYQFCPAAPWIKEFQNPALNCKMRKTQRWHQSAFQTSRVEHVSKSSQLRSLLRWQFLIAESRSSMARARFLQLQASCSPWLGCAGLCWAGLCWAGLQLLWLLLLVPSSSGQGEPSVSAQGQRPCPHPQRHRGLALPLRLLFPGSFHP